MILYFFIAFMVSTTLFLLTWVFKFWREFIVRNGLNMFRVWVLTSEHGRPYTERAVPQLMTLWEAEDLLWDMAAEADLHQWPHVEYAQIERVTLEGYKKEIGL